jgi:hypothetical protein
MVPRWHAITLATVLGGLAEFERDLIRPESLKGMTGRRRAVSDLAVRRSSSPHQQRPAHCTRSRSCNEARRSCRALDLPLFRAGHLLPDCQARLMLAQWPIFRRRAKTI